MIKAIEDKIFVEVLKRKVSTGGIILPEGAQDPQTYGRVISLGKTATDKGIKIGDIVVCHVRGGMDSVIGYKLFKILKLDEVYGTLEDKETLKSLEEIELKPSKGPEKSKIIKL
ncbi:MAG TPA: hypothetical protein VMX17_05580 [Candidatus Glassbacteria bacterium]|nr:hypothetical protein [Candidatus Glassbacteria bacterium]